MSTEPNLTLPPSALKSLTDGINKAHSELKDLGMIGEATAGRGFSELALSGMELGHDGLAGQFKTFCERWEWGVRTLMQRGNVLAGALGLAAGGIHEQDQYVKDTIKIATNAVNGNPHLSEEEVTAKSWAEIRSQTPTDGADWSKQSFSEAHAEVKQVWEDTSYDISHQLLDSMERSGMYTTEERAVLDEVMRRQLDPTDAAVQRAKQPPAWSED
ncbi:hypothetical protein [Streptomyces sp. TRM49041]|uniref:hypothetical protein n=1 Tax=Streptomyces sp. TRM49041 TaxID=2603216 RepID=UPI0011ED557D|nr:hypothetical protein [Streptomyces sp. TRM49041]